MAAKPSDASLRADPVLEVERVSQRFKLAGKREVFALNEVSFTLMGGETLGVVGESGCGKSTLLRTILQAPRALTGSVRLLGQDLGAMSRRELAHTRPRMGMVFQDPHSSLDPSFTLAALVAEPLAAQRVPKRARLERLDALFEMVGLDVGDHGGRRPSEVSGGQLQRVAIARALALEPVVLLCDEVVSALDVSVQAQVLNILEEVRQESALATMMVSHDLGVVRHVSDRIAVMYLGSVMEIGPTDNVYEGPAHPYTAALISAAPAPAGGPRPSERIILRGDLPSPVNPPQGCLFNTRCPQVKERCLTEVPKLRPFGPQHYAACHFPRRAPQPSSLHFDPAAPTALGNSTNEPDV